MHYNEIDNFLSISLFFERSKFLTKEEYKTIIDGMVKEPDKITVTAKTLIDEINKDAEQLETLRTVNEEQEKRIKDLQDTNIKLFLSQTGQGETTEEEKPIDPHELAKSIIE